MAYRYEALSVEGFIQQLAVNYIPHGYWFYVAGRIPSHKNVEAVDKKLISKYGIESNSWTRSRRKQQGLASVHYIRHLNFFVLVANEGMHRFREEEARRVRDVREIPLRYGGYALSYVAGHSCVRIESKTYDEIRDEFLRCAVCKSPRQLEWAIRSLPFEPYAPIRLQLLSLLRRVNKKRKAAGLEMVSKSCLRFYRNIYSPFDGAGPSPRSHLLRKAKAKENLISGKPENQITGKPDR